MTITGLQNVERLSQILGEGLGLVGGQLEREIESVTKVISKKGARELRKRSPNRTGQYGKGWTARKIGTRWVIFNKDRYQLTHLLEKGHPSRLTGVNVQPIVHIAPIEQELVEEYLNELERILRG